MLHSVRQRKAVLRYQALRREVMSMSPAIASAMLSGIESQHVVTGQYTDGKGGACPLLAANRSGAPLHLQTNFPSTWDLFCGLKSHKQAREATRHEIKMLRLLLEERLMPAQERKALPGELPPVTRAPRYTPPRARRVGAEDQWQRELSHLLTAKKEEEARV